MAGRWELARYGWRSLGRTRQANGGARVGLIVFLVTLTLIGGMVGVALSVLVMVASVSAGVGKRIERWRTRPVERYLNEVDATQEVLQEQLAWASREIAARDRRIADLEERSGTEGRRG